MDFTPQVKLSGISEKRYRRARGLLVVIFLFSVAFIGYRILFPITRLAFEFGNRKDSSPLIAHFIPANDPAAEKKELPAEAQFSFRFFDSEPRSRIEIELNLVSGEILETDSLTLQTGYQAFAYPLSPEKAAFPDGTLLRSEGKYIIVSGGKIHRFTDENLARKMGFDLRAFVPATAEEISFSPLGEDIWRSDSYPDDTLFSIDGHYYALRRGRLVPFISAKAFASRFSPEIAIKKPADFIRDYPLSSETIGFAEGSLLALGEKVFVVRGGRSYPVPDPVTFTSFGFAWEDLIRGVTADEIGEYSEEQLFDMTTPHPSGTVFETLDSEGRKRHYLVWDGQKKEIRGNAILAAWLKKKPVLVSERSLSFEGRCRFRKNSLFFKNYSCLISDPAMKSLPGNGYLLKYTPTQNLSVSKIRITFSDNFTWNNLYLSLSRIKNRLISNYAQ